MTILGFSDKFLDYKETSPPPLRFIDYFFFRNWISGCWGKWPVRCFLHSEINYFYITWREKLAEHRNTRIWYAFFQSALFWVSKRMGCLNECSFRSEHHDFGVFERMCGGIKHTFTLRFF